MLPVVMWKGTTNEFLFSKRLSSVCALKLTGIAHWNHSNEPRFLWSRRAVVFSSIPSKACCVCLSSNLAPSSRVTNSALGGGRGEGEYWKVPCRSHCLKWEKEPFKHQLHQFSKLTELFHYIFTHKSFRPLSGCRWTLMLWSTFLISQAFFGR